MQPLESSPQTKIHNPLSVMQPGERVICEIKRHPAGMLGVYATCGALILALAILTFIAAPAIFSGNRNESFAIGAVLFLLITSAILAFVYIENKVYWGNSWIVTSDSITQVTQTSLFGKQSSQLSLANIEDVTAERNGILPQMLNYGRLRAQTAGEHGRFIFAFCPNPDYYAKKILAAREEFEQQRSSEQAAGRTQAQSQSQVQEQNSHQSNVVYQPQPQSQDSYASQGQPAPSSSPLSNQPQQEYQVPPASIFPNEPPRSAPSEPRNQQNEPPHWPQ